MANYQALQVSLNETGEKTELTFITRQKEAFLDTNLVIKVHYSDVNYKDALLLNPKSGVTRNYPIVGGIDCVGEVMSSPTEKFEVGDQVIVTGFDFGVNSDGGYSQYVSVPPAWVVKLPEELSEKDAIIYGTAGVTAAISLTNLLNHRIMETKNAPILVTGASGGVGGLAIMMLNHLGFTNITGLTRDASKFDYLQCLGVTHPLLVSEFTAQPAKALMKQQYAAAIDTVGGELLTHIIPQIEYGGPVLLSGNAGGIKLDTTVLPFILRGVQILGIDSVSYPIGDRQTLWELMATSLKPKRLTKILQNTVSFAQLPHTLESFLNTPRNGRVIVKIN